ncbi:putative YopX protein [Campylobacter phage vB_CjeM_Los1]|uniref:Putative YopX protein n=1 Tax=Campylobacter phage vB_CjeM_Los1 TaxID=1904491 RepID=A0A1D8EXE6_9CAUD|nr:putative YopX protein [Campylobacter phage vB_CjeM_Los1]AOT25909.1 putative YopX protein [Campylobacter phage vB_CjeM_Los1]
MKLDYRVWDDKNKKFYYSENPIDGDVELFTGYIDENGNKIYVGDILEYTRWCEKYMEDDEHSETIYEIVCFDIKDGLYSKLSDGECGWFFEHFMDDKNKKIKEMWLFGNIHENMNLLKDEE